MKKDIVITKVMEDRWREAQQFEKGFAKSTISSGDDWNRWWKDKFDDYNILRGRTFPNVLEGV